MAAATVSPLLLLHKHISNTALPYSSTDTTTTSFGKKKKNWHVSFCLSSTSTSTSSSPLESEKPRIEFEFLSPKPEADGSYAKQTASADSGEKLLRNVMIDNKIELYAPYGKLMNCGGGGSCGTCIVEIIDGQELLNERTGTEKRYLKKKPESWRLACQTIVGNKENAGKVTVQRLPQWKK